MASSRTRLNRILMRLRRIIRNNQLILSILAVFVGAAAGGGVIAIRELINLIQGLSLGGTSENLISIDQFEKTLVSSPIFEKFKQSRLFNCFFYTSIKN